MFIQTTPAERDFSRYLIRSNVGLAISTSGSTRAWFATEDAVQEAIRLAKAAGLDKARANKRLDRVSGISTDGTKSA